MTGYYCRHTLTLVATTVYADAHEHAHQRQHATGSIPWRLWVKTAHWPIAGALSLIAVEIEACALALLELHGHGILTPGDVTEAVHGLLTYCRP